QHDEQLVEVGLRNLLALSDLPALHRTPRRLLRQVQERPQGVVNLGGEEAHGGNPNNSDPFSQNYTTAGGERGIGGPAQGGRWGGANRSPAGRNGARCEGGSHGGACAAWVSRDWWHRGPPPEAAAGGGGC